MTIGGKGISKRYFKKSFNRGGTIKGINGKDYT